MFHRRYGGQGFVTVTFHGNGGLTSSSEASVEMQVKKGSEWRDVSKPEFFQLNTAKRQNGFVLVQGDDNTFIDGTYVVNTDMNVWASYTVVELGVITYAGEVMSVSEWINKYGENCYKTGVYGSPEIIEEMREHLIEIMYFKHSDTEAFGLMAGRIVNGRYEGGLRRHNLRIGGYDLDISQYGGSSIDGRSMQYPQVAPLKFPGLFNPMDFDNTQNFGIPTSAIAEIMSVRSGKADTNVLYNNILDSLIDPNCPYLDNIMAWSAGSTIPAGSFYLPSPYQMSIISQNRLRIVEQIINPLEQWMFSGIHTLGYSYLPIPYTTGGAGFDEFGSLFRGERSEQFNVYPTSYQVIIGQYRSNYPLPGYSPYNASCSQITYHIIKDEILVATMGGVWGGNGFGYFSRHDESHRDMFSICDVEHLF